MVIWTYFFTKLSEAVSRCKLVGAMRASSDRLITGAGFRHPVIVRRAPVITGSIIFV